MEFSPNLDCLYDLSDSSFALFDFFMRLLLLTRALLLHLFDHMFRLFLLHGMLGLELLFPLRGWMEVEAGLDFIDLLEATIAVIVISVLLILHIGVLVLGEDVTGLLGGRIGLYHDLVLIQSLKDDLAIREGLNDGTELGQIEFFILDDQSLRGEVDEDLAKCHLAMLLELGDVDVEGPGDVVLVDDDEFFTDLLSTG